MEKEKKAACSSKVGWLKTVLFLETYGPKGSTKWQQKYLIVKMMKTVNPYINFDGNTEEVFTFFKSIFGGLLDITRFKDMGDSMGVSAADAEKVAHVALPLTDDIILMGSDALESLGQELNEGNNFYINLEADSIAEAEQLFNGLADEPPIMSLQETEWAERFGMCTDRYGTCRMMSYTGRKAEEVL